ncbi:YkgJ family cysteine cluster protein [bacterium]
MSKNKFKQKKKENAGEFSSWLKHARLVQKTEEGMVVPCGTCNACCRSSYFIHIGAEESKTLSVIPNKLKFPAPGLPKGNVLLGYDENGHCPMFVENQCSIYDYRPKICRIYDCRVFSATGLSDDDSEKASIVQQAKQWEFSYPNENDQKEFEAVQAATKFLMNHCDCFPDNFIPKNTTQQAVLAIKVYKVFLNLSNEHENADHADGYLKIAKVVMKAFEEFERGSHD